ncbi:MAG: flagellar hook-basal body complex protein FliE [Armatimonadetes bacterium]|nr:flagellar hook-basal body complex protein FliE [Armatimonadota bacterium]NIM24380.1 flagellar hook-basal body complex protein FliE [Armatimonadota bacterium]NIM68249.1 flagellar hook-basal body complex protein FliE [Armatimonadota bacterium]NIM75150.1 flagellar hook-basal body complex protein FliE [Armatimonadota bacterium]NIN06454.1 flagellar hook-basal body complex protein FliE [Armatimonadota bacterium]
MKINGIQANGDQFRLLKQASEAEKDTKSFTEMLNDAVEQVNEMQKEADSFAVKAAAGDLEDVHQAVVAMEKAVLALEFAVQVRNKAIEAYQELMRTQM